MYCRSLQWCWSSCPPCGCTSCAECSECSGWVSVVIACSGGDQVDEGEDQDPHDVDEVPVEADDLDQFGLVGGCAAAGDHADDREQDHDPDRDVNAVEPGERVEARREQAGGEAETL